MSFTKGKRDIANDDFARVYDRLRKRSYRNNWTSWKAVQKMYGSRTSLHNAYVRGVKDALAAIIEIDEEWATQWMERELADQEWIEREVAEQEAWLVG